MKECKVCHVKVLDHTATCPLCNRILSKAEDDETIVPMYPDVQFDKKTFQRIRRSFMLIVGLATVISVFINVLTYSGFWWSIIVAAAGVYSMMTVSYSITHHANPAAKIVVETLGAGILVYVIDRVLGYAGWSVDYAIPGLILVGNVGIGILMVVNRMNWYSYVLYQWIIAALSVIPLILFFTGYVKHPLMIFIAVGVSLLIIIVSVTFGDRKGKRELMRRFHT